MANEKEVTCIICPIGCKILFKIEGTEFKVLKGNKCKKGIYYAKNEALDPRRMLTTSVLVENGNWPLVSVKSSKPVPKEKLIPVLKKIKRVNVKAPVNYGEVIIKNIENTGIDIIATKTIEKR